MLGSSSDGRSAGVAASQGAAKATFAGDCPGGQWHACPQPDTASKEEAGSAVAAPAATAVAVAELGGAWPIGTVACALAAGLRPCEACCRAAWCAASEARPEVSAHSLRPAVLAEPAPESLHAGPPNMPFGSSAWPHRCGQRV
mmetsp:Transcript_32497/g.97862  ORF Transcript_32497/g.97862 Transcript_32497/m.97862 type:complete len:143 (-) Transcript_32497:196-624(-)